MSIHVEQLGGRHKKLLGDFYAEKDAVRDSFNTYLNISALSDQAKGKAITHLLIEEDENGNETIIGFYSLRASSLIKDTDEYDGEKTGEPAVEIYQFAVKKERQGLGYGRMLMKDVIATVGELSQKIGIMHILVCSVEQSVGFYEKNLFKKLPNFATRHIPRNESNIKCIGLILPIAVK